MRKFLLLVSTFGLSVFCHAQDFSNKGKDFWVAYGYHQIMTSGNAQQMVLYFATDQVTNITITIPGSGYTQTLVSGPTPTIITSAPIPKAGVQDARLLNESSAPESKGIHIVSDKPMVAYAHIYNQSVSGATVLFPTNTLGKEYYSVNYENVSNTTAANCWMYVIATDTGTTTVEITPKVATLNRPAGVPFNVNLSQGQVFNLMSTQIASGPNRWGDLTGSRIRSISSGNAGCKRIAVFSGSGRISIACPNTTTPSSDNYMVQAFPKSAWGKKYLTVRTAVLINNIYRICVSDPAAVVTVNGSTLNPATLQSNFYYEIPPTSNLLKIESDLPILVAQYTTSQSACGNGSTGDPEVIYLSPVEQNIEKVTWNATPNFAISTHYFNVVIPNTGTAISSFKLDGNPVSSIFFQPHPQDPAFSYLIQNVGPGSHTIQSDSGFNAIAYGFGQFESYGYNAGTNVKDIYQQISVGSEYGIETTPTICAGAPFRFKVRLPYAADSINWDLSSLPGPPVPSIVRTTFVPTPGPDSTTVINGKTLYWYSIPTPYSFTQVGTYPVTITTFAPDLEGCGTLQTIDFELTITEPPIADFTHTTPICVAETVQFTDNSTTSRPFYRWWWNFGDPGSGANNTSTINNPSHLFSGPGTYTVRYMAISTSGCVTDTISKPITINPLPNATLTGSTTVCTDIPVQVTFTGTAGAPEFVFTYTIDAGSGPGAPITATSTGGVAVIDVPTNAAGTFIYTLTSVANVGSTLCTQNITGQVATIVVNANATLTLTSAATTTSQVICPALPIANITYAVGSGGTGAVVSGLPAGVNGAYSAGVFTISGTPTVTGLFNYTVTTTGPCVQESKSGTITILQNHTITLSSGIPSTNQTVCGNNALNNITYTLGGGATGATVTGLPPGVSSSVSGNTLTISGTPSTNVGSPFNYSIITTGNNCITASANGTITVLPDHAITLSSAPATASQTVCINNAIINITYTLSAGATGATVTGLPTGVTAVVSGTTVTISGTPSITTGSPFSYTISTTGNACAPATLSGTITVNANHTISLSSAPTTTNQTVCINTPITTIQYLLGGGATGATVTGLPAGVSLSTSGANILITGSPTTVTGSPFNYTITTTGNNCLTSTISGTIAVLPDHAVALTSAPATANQTVCINTAITNITYTLSAGATGATITGLPAGVTANVSGTSVTISGTPTTSVGSPFNFTVTTTGNACVTATLTGSITVNANHSITLTSGVPSTNQTVCINTTIAPITYDLQGGATGATVTGLPTGVTSSVSGNVLTISGSPSTITGSPFSYSIITTGNNCIVATASGTIAVLPDHAVSLTSAPATSNQTICVNTAITNITYQFSAGATGATVTGLPAGVNAVVTGSTITISGSPSVTLGSPFNFTITTTGNACQVATLSGTITVNPDHSINLVSGIPTTNQTVCISNAITAIVYELGGGATNATVTGLPAGITSSLSGTTLTLSGSPSTVTGSPFNYTITTTGNNCIVATANGSITVNALPTASITGTTTVCQGGTEPGITFTGAGTVAPYTFTYSVNSGAPITATTTSGNSITILQPTTTAGVFTYTLISVQDGSMTTCSQAQAGTAVVTVNPLPTATISGGAEVCINATRPEIVFTGAGGTAPYTFTYNINGGANQTITTTSGNSIILQASTAAGGSFVYNLVSVSDASATNCSQAQTGAVTIEVSNIFPRPDFRFNDTVCLPNAIVQFQNLSTISNNTALTYVWNFGDGTPTSSALNPSHTYAAVGPYTVSLQARSTAGCVKDTQIVLNTIHPAPIADFEFNKPSVCIADDITVLDRSDGLDGFITNWNWNFGDGNASTQQNPVPYTYANIGQYNVSLRVVNSFGCASESTTKPFSVYPFPVVDAGPDLAVLENGSTPITPNVTGNDLQFLWLPNQYLNSNTAPIPVSSPLADITYTLTVTARGGCSASDQVFIKVLKGPEIPNTFSPNNDGINDFWDIQYLETYPNNRVQVFTRTGKLVFESRGYRKRWDGNMNGKSLPVDTYYYIIEPGNGQKSFTGYVTIIK